MEHYCEYSERIKLSDLHGCAGNIIIQKSGFIVLVFDSFIDLN